MGQLHQAIRKNDMSLFLKLDLDLGFAKTLSLKYPSVTLEILTGQQYSTWQ